MNGQPTPEGFVIMMPAYGLERTDVRGPLKLEDADTGRPFLPLFTDLDNAQTFIERSVGLPCEPRIPILNTENLFRWYLLAGIGRDGVVLIDPLPARGQITTATGFNVGNLLDNCVFEYPGRAG